MNTIQHEILIDIKEEEEINKEITNDQMKQIDQNTDILINEVSEIDNKESNQRDENNSVAIENREDEIVLESNNEDSLCESDVEDNIVRRQQVPRLG